MAHAFDQYAAGDPLETLLAMLAKLEPGLAPDTVVSALAQAAAQPERQRRIARAALDQPDLLTGQGARAPLPGVLKFIHALGKPEPSPWSSRHARTAAGESRWAIRSTECVYARDASRRPGR
jgi:hypothetical protein